MAVRYSPACHRTMLSAPLVVGTRTVLERGCEPRLRAAVLACPRSATRVDHELQAGSGRWVPPWLHRIGSLLIPGIGPVIAGGVLGATLVGAGVGAAAGGPIGLLTEMGVPEVEARHFEGSGWRGPRLEGDRDRAAQHPRPVTREEIAIERHPVAGGEPARGDVGDE